MPLTSAEALSGAYDVCVVGAGPAGIACALDCHDSGLKTLLLDAGGERPIPGYPDVISADIADPRWHDPPELIAASALGGSSHWWGGRALALDRSDFAHWPISYSEMSPWWEKAAAFLGVPAHSISPPPPAFARLQTFDVEGDECWGPQLNVSKRWHARLRAADGPAIVLSARVTDLVLADTMPGVRVRVGADTHEVRAGQIVLACGGLGVLRLLLLAQRTDPSLFGGADGPLGRGYMGHLTGVIADLSPAVPSDAAAFACRRVEGGAFARRRLRIRDEAIEARGIANTAFWLDNAIIADPAHGDAAASAKFLAARLARFGRGEPADIAAHVRNVARAPLSAAAGVTRAGAHLLRAKLTGAGARATRLLPNGPNRYRLHYHGEQRRDPKNRISLSAQTDSIGLPRLRIDFRMSDDDVESVIRAHEALDADLQAANAGRLHWQNARDVAFARVRDAARDGYHQLGGAAMSRDAASGVVDTLCRPHGVSNVWLAAGCVHASGGQANPTLTIVALARRVADSIARAARG